MSTRDTITKNIQGIQLHTVANAASNMVHPVCCQTGIQQHQMNQISVQPILFAAQSAQKYKKKDFCCLFSFQAHRVGR